MTVRQLVDSLGLTEFTPPTARDREIHAGYASDLLSDVIAHAQEGDLWITLQVHLNIVAVAVMKELAAVVITGGRRPQEETLAKARDQGVALLGTALPAFDLAVRLHAAGVRGSTAE